MKKNILLLFAISLFIGSTFAQKDDKVYNFTTVKQIKTTPVKDQAQSGTCWSFATTSFIETEMLRLGKPEVDLSEMFFVRNAYPLKALKYVRLHGSSNFGPGGQAHDVINMIRDYGIVPDEIYNGKNLGESKHYHNEMDAVLKAMLDAIVNNKDGKISTAWKSLVDNTLDTYLGKIPTTFNYNGKSYNAISFKKDFCGINPDDYIEITSFNHHPFYQKLDLEVPDNWSNGLYYNLPMNEMMNVIENALSNGYSVAWDGDVSEKEFSNKKGFAIVPLNEDKSKTEITTEKTITQEMRQSMFDNYSTTDDHLMHIVGKVNDQKGNTYYLTKNSWSATGNDFGGYINLSEAFVKLKTVAILIHKDAIPAEIAKKIGLK
ncbi:MAG: aminopeptidase [Bacteroidetes bacterium]|nr:aminopeptidase [Bacteroidota bacterium]